MKRFFTSLILVAALILPMAMSAQNTSVTIGTGTSTTYNVPYNNDYRNATTEMLYLATEVGTSGQIDSVAWNVSTASSFAYTELNIYMGTTTSTSLSSSFTDFNDLQLVYSSTNGTIGASTGWESVALTTPFYYDGIDNLVVVVCRKSSSYNGTLKYYYASTTGRCRYYRSDSNSGYGELNSSYSGSSSSYLPNMKLSINTSATAPCTRPASVTASNITASSADITFTAGGTESAWIGEISPAVNGVSTMALTSTGTVSLTGLTQNTAYTVGVRSICSAGDTSVARTVSFTTPCLPVASADLPYTENFDSYTSGSGNSISACWHKGTNSSTQYPYPYSYQHYGDAGNALYMYGYSTTSYSYAALPLFDTAISNLMMNLKVLKTSDSYGYLQVGTMSDPSDISTFTPMDTLWPSATYTWEDFEVLFNTYTGTDQYIALVARGGATGSSNYVYVDEISVDLVPSCLTPTTIALVDSATTSSSITLGWTERNTATSWLVTYTNTEDTTATPTSVVATSNPYTITGLAANTPYEITVKSICSAGDTSAATHAVVRTGCPLAVTAPYYENFDNYSGVSSSYYYSTVSPYVTPSCWTAPENSTTASASYTNNPQVFITNSTSYTNGSQRLVMRGYSTTQPAVAVLPLFTNAVNTLQLDFVYRQYSSYYGTLQIGVMTDPTDTSSFTALETLDRATSFTQVSHDFSLDTNLPSASTLYIALRHLQGTNTTYYASFIDDIAVTVAPTCKTPRNLAVTCNGDTVNASWTAAGNSTTFQLGYGEHGTSTDNLTLVSNISADSAAVVIPTAGIYDIYVRTDCGTEYSEWAGPVMGATGMYVMDSNATFTNCGIVLVDDGGLSGNYGNSRNDTVCFISSDQCSTFRIAGNVNTENGWDYIYLYTDSTSTTAAAAYCGSTDIDFTSPSGYLKVVFYSDNSGSYSGFMLNVTCATRPMTLPYTEDFENGTGCLSIVYGDGEGTSNPIVTNSSAAHSGSNGLRFSSYNNTTDYNQYAILPAIADTTSVLEMSFWYKKSSRWGSDVIYVGTSTTDNAVESFTWTELPMSTDWHQYSGYIMAGTKYIALRGYGDYSYYSYVDDISITEAPSCLPVQQLAVSGATDSSLTIGWTNLTAPASSYLVSYDTVTVATTSNPYTIQGLDAYTEYTISVTPLCSATDTGATATITGRTLVNCGSTLAHNDTIGTIEEYETSAFYGSTYYDAGLNQVLYTSTELREMGMGVNNQIHGVQLKASSDATINQAKVYIKEVAQASLSSEEDTVALSDMTLVYSGDLTFNANTWKTIPFTSSFNYSGAGNLVIAFVRDSSVTSNITFASDYAYGHCYYSHTSDGYTYGGVSYNRPTTVFDYCTETPSCWYVTDVAVSNITNQGADITWNLLDSTQTNFVVAYGTGNNPDLMSTVNASTNSVSLTGLTGATVYNVYVKAACDTSSNSIWSMPASFTTNICGSEDQCEINISMYDEWGDGWNGASFSIVDTLTGITVGTYTLDDGDSSITTASLCDGRVYNIVWNAAYYDEEASLTITGYSGNTIFTQNNMDGESGVIATFTHNCSLEITVDVNDTLMGIATGAGSYAMGDTVTLTATANDHYHFVMWNDSVTTNPRTIVVNGNAAYTAIFAINQYTVSAAALDTLMGTVTGAGTYDYGTEVTLTAVPNQHYTFLQWNDGDTVNPRIITVAGDTAFVAVFQAVTYTVTADVNDTLMGTVTGAGTYTYGEDVILTAVPNQHYTFVQWNDGITTNPRTITVAGDTTLTAIFEAETYTITVTANDDAMGTVSGAGVYTYLDTVTISAVANEGYVFVRWDNGDTNATLTFVAEADASYQAIFATMTGIDDIDMSDIQIIASNCSITVNGAEGQMIRIFDVSGRVLVSEKAADGKTYTMPATGVYLVKVGNYPARKVVVVK